MGLGGRRVACRLLLVVLRAVCVLSHVSFGAIFAIGCRAWVGFAFLMVALGVYAKTGGHHADGRAGFRRARELVALDGPCYFFS